MSSPPDSEKFDLVFRGILAKGVDATVAKHNLGQLFKIDAKKVETLFSGKPIVLKRNLSLDAAHKYRVAIKKAGALVDVEAQEASKERPVSRGKANFGTHEPSASVPAPKKSSDAPGMIPGTETENKSDNLAPPVASKQPEGLSLLPLWTAVLRPQEQVRPEPVVVDTSSLSVRANEGNLLEPEEYQQVPERQVDLAAFDLAEPGADVLKPEEREQVQALEVDTDGISLAPPGSRLEAEKPPAPPAPDVSRISLKEQ